MTSARGGRGADPRRGGKEETDPPRPSLLPGHPRWERVLVAFVGLGFWYMVLGAAFSDLRFGLSLGEWFGAAFATLVLIGAVAAGLGATDPSVRHAEDLRDYRQRLRRAHEEGGDVQAVFKQARERGGDILASLQRHDQYVLGTDASQEFQDALHAGLPHLPGYPRNAIRYVNRLRFLVFLAGQKRELFGPGGVEAESVGYWCVVAENWPELSHVLAVRPDLVRRLQDLAAGSQRVFEREVTRLAPSVGGDPDVHPFFARMPGRWADDVWSINRLRPIAWREPLA